MLEAAINLFNAIIIAVVSAAVTVHLSLRRFRTERWWERRVQAYERVIAALHEAKAFADDHLQAKIDGKELSDAQSGELRVRSKIAHEEIGRAMDVGAFLLSNEALSRLKQYRQEVSEARQERDWFDSIQGYLSATDECLKDVVLIAKKDLRVK